MVLVYFKIRRRDGSGRPFEKIVPIEVKAKVFDFSIVFIENLIN